MGTRCVLLSFFHCTVSKMAQMSSLCLNSDSGGCIPVILLILRYGAEQGQGALREAIAKVFYPGLRSADEVFVSDGSKCDIARLQVRGV